MVVRVALWCAPVSAPAQLLASFSARPDCVVSDEPLAAAVAHASLPHAGLSPEPSGQLAGRPTDWTQVIDQLVGEPPSKDEEDRAAAVWVQRHSADHLLLDKDRDWLRGHRHAFVIRDPSILLTSAMERGSHALLEATGLPHQLELYRWLREAGEEPVVVCQDALSRWPEELLPEVCRRLGIAFHPAMLKGFGSVASTSPTTVAQRLGTVPPSTRRSCQDMYAELVADALCGPVAATV